MLLTSEAATGGALQKKFFLEFRNIQRKTPVLELQVFPAFIAKFLRTPILLAKVASIIFQNNFTEIVVLNLF